MTPLMGEEIVRSRGLLANACK